MTWAGSGGAGFGSVSGGQPRIALDRQRALVDVASRVGRSRAAISREPPHSTVALASARAATVDVVRRRVRLLRGRRDHDHDLAAGRHRGAWSASAARSARRTSSCSLVSSRADHRLARAEPLRQQRQRVRDPRTGFEQHQCCGQDRDFGDAILASGLLAGQEPCEQEPIGGQAGNDTKPPALRMRPAPRLPDDRPAARHGQACTRGLKLAGSRHRKPTRWLARRPTGGKKARACRSGVVVMIRGERRADLIALG